MLWARARRNASERLLAAECRERLERLGEAAGKYAAAHGDRYPFGDRAVEELLVRYLRHRKFAFCPASNRPFRWTSRSREVTDPAHLLLAWENPAARAHGKLLALFVGGRVKEIDREELRALLADEKKEPRSRPRRRKTPRPGLREPPDAPPARKLPPRTKGPPPPKYDN